jgi:hypothetical protein
MIPVWKKNNVAMFVKVDVFTHHFLMWAQCSDEGEDSGDDMVLYRRGTDGQKAQLRQLLLDNSHFCWTTGSHFFQDL